MTWKESQTVTFTLNDIYRLISEDISDFTLVPAYNSGFATVEVINTGTNWRESAAEIMSEYSEVLQELASL